MGSTIVKNGKTPKGKDYRIYNIDNTYTIYIKINTQSNNEVPKPIFSATASFNTLKEAEEHVAKI